MAQSLFRLSETLTSSHINRLSGEEINYELTVRGLLITGNVENRRKSLRSALRLEKAGHSLIKIKHPYQFDEEINDIKVGIAESTDIFETWNGDNKDNVTLKLSAKLCHLLGRINRSVPGEDNESQFKVKNELMVKITDLIDDCRIKIKRRIYTSTPERIPIDITQLSLIDSESDSSDSEAEPIMHDNNESNSEKLEKINFVPIYKWGLKYSGKMGESINSFLRDVEEHCRSRNVNQKQLLQSAGDLFAETAKMWYRANFKQFSSWDQLVAALKIEFLSPNYDEELYERIKKRTQSPQESVGMYFAIMTTLFEDLNIKLSEKVRIKIIKANLLPLYQNQLALNKPDSLEELKNLCKKLEASRYNVEHYQPPKIHRRNMEPELAVVNEIRCYICRELGHVRRECPKRPQIKCFGCGAPGVIKPKCPKCQGNDNWR